MSSKLKNSHEILNGSDFERIFERPASMFQQLRDYVNAVVDGEIDCLIVYGPTSTGKSFAVLETLKHRGLCKGEDYERFAGSTSPAGLYRSLFWNRKKRLTLFDNFYPVLNHSNCAKIAASAVDSRGDRSPTWPKNRRVSDTSSFTHEELDNYCKRYEDSIRNNSGESLKLPSKYKFDGGIIAITNLEKNRINQAIRGVSETIRIDMDDDELFCYMHSILPNYGKGEVPLEVKRELLNSLYDKKVRDEIQYFDLRTLLHVIEHVVFHSQYSPDKKPMEIFEEFCKFY